MNDTLRELNSIEAAAVAGGYDDYLWCGTPPIPRPWTLPIWQFEPEPTPWLVPIHFGGP